jgi:hypothetical protein
VKSCPFCGWEIPVDATVCVRCGRAQPESRDATSAASPKPDGPEAAAAAAKRRKRIRVGLAVIAVLALVAAYRVSRGAGSGGVLSLLMYPRTITMTDRAELAVPPGKFQTWEWTVSPHQPRCHVTGHFMVPAGGGMGIQAYVLSQAEFTNLVNYRAARAYFRSDDVASLTLDVVTTDPGPMVLAVSGAASGGDTTVVRATGVKAVCQ